MRAIAVLTVVFIALSGFTASADAKHRRHHHRRHHHSASHAPQPAPAPPSPSPKPASFDGSCDFAGAVTFTPPMTSSPQHVAQHANAPGSCSGTFVDHAGNAHQLQNAPTTYEAESSGDSVSCAFGLASGTGALVFPDGQIAFAMNEYRLAATPMLRLTGKDGGGAWMPATPSQNSDPTAAVEACNGSGLKEFDLSGHLMTDSPIRG